jgi:predicted metal-dependent enzyme (double-stranded beta helix superfamily)
MATTLYTLQDFVRDAQEVAGQRLSPERAMTAMARPLERIIARRDCLADFPGSDSPDPDRGFVIYRAPNLTILAVVWPAGGGAPIHNHNGWAMEGVISGMELNRNYQRVDDGSQPWRAKLEEVEPSRVGTGEITSLGLPPANDIHAVEIPAGKSLAIHVYGHDLLSQWRYQFDAETGEVKPFMSRRTGQAPGGTGRVGADAAAAVAAAPSREDVPR